MTSYHETDATFDQWRELRMLPAFEDWEEAVAKKAGKKLVWPHPLFPKNLKWTIDQAQARSRLIYADEFSDETFREILVGKPRYHLAVEVVDQLYSEIMQDPASIMPKTEPPDDRDGLREWLKDFSSGRWWHKALMLDKPGEGQKAVADSTFKSWISGNAMADKPFSLVLERARFWFDYMHCVCDVHQAAYERIRHLRYGDEFDRHVCKGIQTELKRFVAGATEQEIAIEHRRLWDVAMMKMCLPDFQNMCLVTSNKHTANPQHADELWAKYFENDRKLDRAEPEPEWVSESWEESYDTRVWPVADGDNPLRYSYRREVKLLSRIRTAKDGKKDNLESRIVQFKTLIKDDDGAYHRTVDGREVYYREVWEDCPESMDSYEKVWEPLELLMSRRRHSKADIHLHLSEPPIRGA
ncbi:hypothetical protein GC209_17980 [bacterium]|nr:hypothetical protein [bacterium]